MATTTATGLNEWFNKLKGTKEGERTATEVMMRQHWVEAMSQTDTLGSGTGVQFGGSRSGKSSWASGTSFNPEVLKEYMTAVKPEEWTREEFKEVPKEKSFDEVCNEAIDMLRV